MMDSSGLVEGGIQPAIPAEGKSPACEEPADAGNPPGRRLRQQGGAAKNKAVGAV
jgi:hypothetical protein